MCKQAVYVLRTEVYIIQENHFICFEHNVVSIIVGGGGINTTITAAAAAAFDIAM